MKIVLVKKEDEEYVRQVEATFSSAGTEERDNYEFVFTPCLNISNVDVSDVKVFSGVVPVVVFTSVNAVLSLHSQLQTLEATIGHQIAELKAFCVGKKTAQAIESFLHCEVCGVEKKAADLASLIIAEKTTKEVLFFCGNPHRPELPTLLQKAKIICTEVVCYETIMDKKVIASLHDYTHSPDTVLVFFSPSVANQFLEPLRELQSEDKIRAKGSILASFVAIGPTTGKEFEDCGLLVNVCEEPTPKSVAEEIHKISRH
eukprot:m.19651 g.19651  ORF g.19651 m.19651 type:complete len:259 (-) comp5144_c0_seq2:349-1125(-)